MNKKILKILSLLIFSLLIYSCSESKYNNEPVLNDQINLIGLWYPINKNVSRIFGKGYIYRIQFLKDSTFREVVFDNEYRTTYYGFYSYRNEEKILILDCETDYRGYYNIEWVPFYFKKDTLMLDFEPFLKHE